MMKPGDSHPTPGGSIVAVAADHGGARYSHGARSEGQSLGYVIRSPHRTIYYSGDTRFFLGFERVRLTHRPELSILNINGHLHSADAVSAALAVGAPKVLPVHYGAYGYLIFPEYKKPLGYKKLKNELGPALVELDLGESLYLKGRHK
jgi:L-ascorbate metabolism protein UlaG (beta-lactamase superfamily)